jgi:6-phosphogluconolactonase/glucosamine-6-phosphate isomerase/deaminase
MIGELSIKPTKGLTLGMGEILQAKKIILLIKGAHKKEITKAFLKEK